MPSPARGLWIFIVSSFALLAPQGISAATSLKDNVYGVAALGPESAVVVGTFGSIMTTADGGKTWERHDSGTTDPIFSVEMADAQSGWAVGASGLILHTTDGGKTWTRQQSPLKEPRHLFKVEAIDPKTAWAVGDWGAIVSTTDGGATWQDRSLGTLTVKTEESPDRSTTVLTDDVILNDVQFPDARHGYVAGEFGTLLATSDGGATWERRDLGTDQTIYGLTFATAERGWLVGIDGMVMRTTDGGKTWDMQLGSRERQMLDDVDFLAAMDNPGLYAVAVEGKYGVIVGDAGTLFVSSDGGDTWTRELLPEDQLVWMRDVSLLPGTRGFVAGADGFVGVVDNDEIKLPTGESATVPR
jgi:photosystem II stability/assembly factor-like uncharacterized protein